MTENKTKPTKKSVEKFIASVEHPVRRADGEALLKLFNRVTKLKPVMWGPSLIGYGRYHYKYDSGREGDMLMTGFSPRKSNLSLYVGNGYRALGNEAEKLGKHKTGASCLYVNKLADIDLKILEKMIRADLKYMRANYETWPE